MSRIPIPAGSVASSFTAACGGNRAVVQVNPRFRCQNKSCRMIEHHPAAWPVIHFSGEPYRARPRWFLAPVGSAAQGGVLPGSRESLCGFPEVPPPGGGMSALAKSQWPIEVAPVLGRGTRVPRACRTSAFAADSLDPDEISRMYTWTSTGSVYRKG